MICVNMGCSGDPPPAYQGYVEGEYVYIASPVGGWLERLLVQRGQTIEAKAPLFQLEDDQETAARDQAEEQAARQLKRDEAQFEVGGIARAQLEDSRANHAIKAARVRELEGQLEVSRLPARADQIRAQNAQVAAARAASEQSTWRLDQKHVAAYEQAGAAYQEAVLLGFQNVADTLRALETDAIKLKERADAAAQARSYHDIISSRYEAGGVSFLALLDAQRKLRVARIDQTQAIADR